MPRRNFQSSKRPIVSNKEIIDTVAFLVTGGVTTDINIASAVNNYTGTIGTQPLGSSLLGFYIETSASNGDSIVNRIDWYLCKRTSGTPFSSFPIPGATGGDVNRKWIFHESKGIGQGEAVSTLGGQTSRMREFIKIPKRFRRMGEADFWSIRVGASTDYNFCLKVIYKWYQ